MPKPIQIAATAATANEIIERDLTILLDDGRIFQALDYGVAWRWNEVMGPWEDERELLDEGVDL